MAGVGYLEGKKYLLFKIALKLDWYRENICKKLVLILFESRYNNKH